MCFPGLVFEGGPLAVRNHHAACRSFCPESDRWKFLESFPSCAHVNDVNDAKPYAVNAGEKEKN